MSLLRNEMWIVTRFGELDLELRQAAEEGKDVGDFQGDVNALKARGEWAFYEEEVQREIRQIMDRIQELPVHGELRGKEPSDLDGIREQRPGGPRRMAGVDYGEARLLEKLHGAWLGRCCGCFLGKPVEGAKSWEMRAVLEAQGRWPLDDYFIEAPEDVKQQHNIKRNFGHFENTWYMPEDDDTNYTTTGLALMETYGPDFTPEHVAIFWLRNIPFLRLATAERVAYRNLAQGHEPPESAIIRNPHREWIGAQIRADFWGYAAAGWPERAAEFAWRDASISHVKNGIYGEMWVAAMLAAAYATDNLQKIITIGLSEIPAECRLAKAVRRVMDLHAEGKTWDDFFRDLHERWDEHVGHDWCHTISNAEIVTAGLLWGGLDYGRSICLAVQAGFDTDCNGATVGSIVGMVIGAGNIPDKWADRLSDTLETGVSGYNRVKISEIARKTVAQTKRVVDA